MSLEKSNFFDKKAPKATEFFVHPKEALIKVYNLKLDINNPSSQNIKITFEKQTITLEKGKTYGNGSVTIDEETKQMKSLAEKAKNLSKLPKRERLEKILELLRDNVEYAHSDEINSLFKKNPELANWVETNVGTQSSGTVFLSEIFANHFGVCRHLSVAYLWLIEKAGLSGNISFCYFDTIKNIKRTDTGQKLFKSTDFDQTVASHAWAEIEISDGEWIPVDPSTGLIGDNEERLAMFKEANYISLAYPNLNSLAKPNDKLMVKYTKPLFFKAGEGSASTICHLELKNINQKPYFDGDNISYTNVPNESYLGNGQFSVIVEESDLDLNILKIEED